MPEEKQTVSGEVGKVVVWNSKKGYFLNLKGQEQDFYAFGAPKAKEGQQATFEVSPGTGSFEDKVKLDKLVTEKKHLPEDSKKADTEFPDGKTVYLTRAEADAIRQNYINRCSAVKSAAELVAAAIRAAPKPNMKEASTNTLHIAGKFLTFIKDEEPELPEPPEDE